MFFLLLFFCCPNKKGKYREHKARSDLEVSEEPVPTDALSPAVSAMISHVVSGRVCSVSASAELFV